MNPPVNSYDELLRSRQDWERSQKQEQANIRMNERKEKGLYLGVYEVPGTSAEHQFDPQATIFTFKSARSRTRADLDT